MLTGKLIKLLETLEQKHLPSTRGVPDQNEDGYGLADNAEGREARSRDVVGERYGFDDRYEGQQAVEQTKHVNR
jgi:hypothetical protein